MKQNETIELLKIFISDRILQRRVEVAAVYSSVEEQNEQLEELRRLEMTSRLQNSVFKYAKWYSGRNEITTLENTLWKIKEIEERIGERAKIENENDRQR